MRVLVIEDEPDLLSVVMQSLRESGYAVDGASDGREGLFKAKSADYDALVLDLPRAGDPRLDDARAEPRLLDLGRNLFDDVLDLDLLELRLEDDELRRRHGEVATA